MSYSNAANDTLLVKGGFPYRADSPVGYAHEFPVDASSIASPYPEQHLRTVNTRPQTGQSAHRPKEYWGYSKWQWAFMVVVMLQAAIGLGLEGFVFAKFEEDLNHWARTDPRSKPYAATVPAYLALFIFGFLYEVGLAWDALRLKNTIQVIGLCLYNIGLLVEAGVQFSQLSTVINTLEPMNPLGAEKGTSLQPDFRMQVNPYVIAMPAVIGLFSLAMIAIAYLLYVEFLWSIYDNMGSSTKIKRALRDYQIYISVLKFDFFFFLAFTVLFLVVVQGTPGAETYLTIAAIPVTILVLSLAWVWVKIENKAGSATIIVVYFAGLAYFFFKLFRMYFSNRTEAYLPARKSLTTFAVLTIVLLIITIVYAIICIRNFGNGLKRSRSNDTELANLAPDVEPVFQRRTID